MRLIITLYLCRIAVFTPRNLWPPCSSSLELNPGVLHAWYECQSRGLRTGHELAKSQRCTRVSDICTCKGRYMCTVGNTTLSKLLVYRRYIQSEHPWALTVHGQQSGVGTDTEKPSERTQEPNQDHQNKGTWVLTRRWASGQ